jgi:hypothetical protein
MIHTLTITRPKTFIEGHEFFLHFSHVSAKNLFTHWVRFYTYPHNTSIMYNPMLS